MTGTRIWAVAWALLVAAASFAAWASWSYWQVRRDPLVSLARERDHVLRVASTEIADLNSLSSAHATVSLRRWLTITTGSLHDQIGRLNVQYLGAVRQSDRTALGTVTAAAVTALHPRSGTAQVIAVVRVDITSADGAAGTQTSRYQAGLTLTADGWKVSSLIAIPATAS